MGCEQVSYSRLADKTERGTAHLATIARADTRWGGARAMVLAARLESMGSAIDADSVVSAVYTGSSSAKEHFAYTCPECGSVHLGISAALACCAFDADWDDDEETKGD